MTQTAEQVKIQHLEEQLKALKDDSDESARELKRQVADLSKELYDYMREQQDRISARDRKDAEEKRKNLLTGISFLGSIILGLGGLVWSQRHIFFNGSSP